MAEPEQEPSVGRMPVPPGASTISTPESPVVPRAKGRHVPITEQITEQINLGRSSDGT
jgi:hypothetical protein